LGNRVKEGIISGTKVFNTIEFKTFDRERGWLFVVVRVRVRVRVLMR